ncbi:hypothetical protein [Geobacter sp. AOG2]|nr:hypothetical protein [Geobacter sp. AOG2]GFE62854.1 hypothetical protein AOG2_34430 [Geobacter sp. AOG2]
MKKQSTIMVMVCFLVTVLCTLAYGWSERTDTSVTDVKNYDAMFYIY